MNKFAKYLFLFWIIIDINYVVIGVIKIFDRLEKFDIIILLEDFIAVWEGTNWYLVFESSDIVFGGIV
jgi:hypothetical protein